MISDVPWSSAARWQRWYSSSEQAGVQSGAVTMVYGGEVVEGKTTAPGEIRGASIKGGTEVVLGPGDVLHIPAKVPHLMKLAKGKKVTYFVAKVVE